LSTTATVAPSARTLVSTGSRFAAATGFDPDTREKVYDTDDCYDLGNAQHKAYAWAAEFMKQEPRDISDPAVVPTVAEALADPAGFVAGMEEFGGEG
jgi:hypothetical protein